MGEQTYTCKHCGSEFTGTTMAGALKSLGIHAAKEVNRHG